MKHQSILAALIAVSVLPSQAASDLDNPLNTYVGNSQADFPAQPGFLSTSGLDVSFVWGGGAGAWEKIDFFDTTAVSPEFPGAKFGANTGGGATEGRNYLRTVETDYHTKDFTAFVTVRRSTANSSVFFGLGTAQLGNDKRPDHSTGKSSVYVELQAYVAPGQGNPGGSGFPNASRNVIGNFINDEVGYHGMNQLTSDALRMRMQYNSTAQTVDYAFDYDYDGVAFQVDQTIPTTSVGTQVAEFYNDGDRASIYFGGDRSVVFTDLVITTTQAPAPTPSGLQVASFGDATATISWPTGVTGATFSVYRSETSGVFTTPLATGLTTNTYTDNGLTNGTPYYYVITQTRPGSLESAFSNEVTATPVAGAITPTGVSAVNGGENALVVDWANLPSPHTYTVRRSTVSGGPFTIVGGPGLTESRFLDESVVDGTTYFYTVNSTLVAAESPQTAEVSAVSRSLEVFVDFNSGTPSYNGAGGLATAPVGTTWNGLGLGSVANLSDSTVVLSSVGLNATGQGTFSKGNGFNVGGDNATPGSQTLTVPGGFDLMQDYIFNNAGGTTITYTLTGLVPGRKYDLYLYGYGDVLGQNTLFGANGILKQTSNPAGLTTLTEGRHFVTFTAVATLDGTVPFTWRNGFTGGGITDADAGSGSALLNGFQLFENDTAVLQPLNLSTFSDTDSVELSWDENGADSYEVYRSTTSAAGYSLLNSAVGSPYDDTSAVPGVTYYYVVKAVVGANKSFFSAEASGRREPLIVDADADGLSDADEALLGTDPNDAGDFFRAQSSAVTPNGANYNINILINGAPGTYVIERSTTLLEASWTEIPSSSQAFTWNTGTVLTNPLNLNATGVTPAPGGKEFFRAKGVAP